VKSKKPTESKHSTLTSIDDEPVSAMAASAGMPTGRMLKRPEAAAILGTSVSTLRRLERSGVLPPVVGGKEVLKRVNLHSEQRILEYKIQCTSARDRSHSSFDGVLASAAFERFDAGASTVEIVKQFKVEPRVARDLYREWADMSGGFVVSGGAATKLQRLAWISDDIQVRSGDDLVALFEQLEKAECSCCERRTPRLCYQCYAARTPRAQKLVAAALAASHARLEERHRNDHEKDVAERARQRSADARDDPPR
jgi:hypothetical protein